MWHRIMGQRWGDRITAQTVASPFILSYILSYLETWGVGF